ncbi:hypothetical protein QBC32DRAFT_175070, partial [Pseudoneurospora amorphoporcata]
MARDNTSAAQARYVHFNPDALKKYAPNDSKLPTSEVRCKSLDPNDFHGPNHQTAASSRTLGGDDADDGDEDDNNEVFDLSALNSDEYYK